MVLKCGGLYSLLNMNLENLKQILTNKVNVLINERNLFYASGDLENYDKKILEIKEVQEILDKLNL